MIRTKAFFGVCSYVIPDVMIEGGNVARKGLSDTLDDETVCHLRGSKYDFEKTSFVTFSVST